MKKYSNIYIHNFILELIISKHKHDLTKFHDNSFFWEKIVKVASSHLLIPAIYEAIKRKNLISQVPKDLISFFKEISKINSNRNKEIFKQIKFLSRILTSNNIDHVFLKGSAMIILNQFNSINERMIGDIDILISKKDILKANDLLLDSGFKQNSIEKVILSKGIITQKHLPRLINPHFIAAVELHSYLFKNDNKNIIKPNEILKRKKQTDLGFMVPSKNHLWEHAILNWQLNDYGLNLNFLNFRSVIDVLLLEPNNVITKIKTSSKPVKHFYSLLSLHLNAYPNYFYINSFIYRLHLTFDFTYNLNWFYFKLMKLIRVIANRTLLIVKSKSYRISIIENRNYLLQKILKIWKN